MALKDFLERNGWIIGVAAFAVVAVAVLWQFKPVAFSASKAVELLTGLSIVTLFVERSMAVINDIWFGEERERTDKDVALLTAKVAFAEARIRHEQVVQRHLLAGTEAVDFKTEAARQASMATTQGRIDTLSLTRETDVVALRNAEKEQSVVKVKQDNLRLKLGFVFALLISAVGVRTLGTLLDVASTKEGLAPYQSMALVGVDVVLTAGLIAGGSTAINALISTVSTYNEALRTAAARRTAQGAANP